MYVFMLDNCLCIKGLWNGVKIVVVKFETMIICKIQLLHKKEPNGEKVGFHFTQICPPRDHNPPNYLLQKYLYPINYWTLVR